MSLKLILILVAVSLMTVIIPTVTAPAFAAGPRIIRIGYLDHPGSDLCRIAAAKGHFREEGLQIELVRFTESAKGLAALEAGGIDVGAFSVGDSLRAIARGKEFRIIAGGGTMVHGNPLEELDSSLQAETESQGIVVLIPPAWSNTEKETLVQLTAALIRAYRTHRQHPQAASSSLGSGPDRIVQFDPNPDYWRLERVWRTLGLQAASMKRDFLSNHVYEEIYCDALDRLQDGSPDDQVYKALSRKAVCTPDCCPKKVIKPNQNQGGKHQ